MTSMLASAATAVSNASTAGQSQRQEAQKVLVAYFSRSGNTQVIAGVISRSLGADLFEIEPARPYPANYFETVEQARQERDSGYEPVLKARVPGIATYQTIFLCFPIWGETVPPLIRSFLTAHDLSARTLVPVIMHGGYGLGGSLAMLRSHASGARVVEGLTLQGPQERQITTRVTEWLNTRHTINPSVTARRTARVADTQPEPEISGSER
jgi:flavodoxin